MRLPTWVGDAVMAIPALRALRRRFPAARVALIGGAHLEHLLAGAQIHDDYLALPRGRVGARAAIDLLRPLHADLAVVLPHSFRAAWETLRAGIPLRVGYAREWRRPLLTHSLAPHRRREKIAFTARLKLNALAGLGKLSKRAWLGAVRRSPPLLAERRRAEDIIPVPMVAQYLELVSVLGATADGQGPRLTVSVAARAAGEAAFAKLGVGTDVQLLAINAGASFGGSKVYPLSILARAVDALCESTGLRPLLLCGPGEESLTAQLEALLTTPAYSTARALLSLDSIQWALTRCRLLITTDTGPWHIANALGTPSVVLMGPTDPRYTASHLRQSIVLREDVPCGPCHLKSCPFAHHRCMTGITPERVVEAGHALLRV
ncbi:MAG: glycosyltransferase family 9 protein [Planctomycetota bacterium]